MPLSLAAQDRSGRVHRIGFLGVATAAEMTPRVEALKGGLRDLGYVEGKNLVIEFRFADGIVERLPALATELTRLDVDLVVTHYLGVLAAKGVTATIPIVQAAAADPVAAGVTTSLARPSGNVTGLTFFAVELSSKRIELLKETIPHISRFALLAPSSMQANEIAPTAKQLKVAVVAFEAQQATEFQSAFAAMVKQKVGGVVLPDTPLITTNSKTLADLALKYGMASAGNPQFADVGGMIGYGVSIDDLFRRSATFVDRLLRGARPADLPFERPARFDFVVNMKTAKVFGIKIPQSLLIRADRVIE